MGQCLLAVAGEREVARKAVVEPGMLWPLGETLGEDLDRSPVIATAICLLGHEPVLER
jgi:hypothetical protein